LKFMRQAQIDQERSCLRFDEIKSQANPLLF
jgi:hypothetical protein